MVKNKVAIVCRKTISAVRAPSELEATHKIKCCAYQADVRVVSQITPATNHPPADFGKLDVIVANAGITSEHAAEDYTPEEFQDIIDTNFNGAFDTARAAARIFKKQGFGNIIFTASVSATSVNIPQKQAAVKVPFLDPVTLDAKMTKTVIG
jgi:NAD(P)-dependent dehydrogenase (short-subunit alcohol dehydrogenase family)